MNDISKSIEADEALTLERIRIRIMDGTTLTRDERVFLTNLSRANLGTLSERAKLTLRGY
jgi:hypothetical protein